MATPEPIPAPPYDDWKQEELRGPVIFGAFDGDRMGGLRGAGHATYTQEGNEPMRAINAKLGYRANPAWILVRREAV